MEATCHAGRFVEPRLVAQESLQSTMLIHLLLQVLLERLKLLRHKHPAGGDSASGHSDSEGRVGTECHNEILNHKP